MAPKLIKLASTLNRYIKLKVNNILKGMIEAITKPERQFPNNKTNTNTTIRQPMVRFSMTVKVVLPINSLLSKNPLI